MNLFTLEQIVLFTRVLQRQLDHNQDCVLDFDIIVRTYPENSPLTALIKNSSTYLALVSRDKLFLFEIEPSLRLLYCEDLREKTTKDVIVRWRHNASLKNPQLFVSYNNKVYIYKLI